MTMLVYYYFMDRKLKDIIKAEKEKYTGAIPALFSKRIRELRKEKGYTQKQFAKLLGMKENTYSGWERGRREPRLYDYLNIIYVLDLDISDFFDISN